MTTQPASDTGLALLTGPEAGELMTAVLDAAGAELLSWRTRQVDHQPGRRTTVSYTARVRWTDGSVTRVTLGAASGELPEAVARLSDGTTEIGMWRFPHDPELPELAGACDPGRMGRLAAAVGLTDGTGSGPVKSAPVRLRLRGYRPRRRAVVQVTAARGTFFAKVVRPGKARELHERHRTAKAAGCPVPDGLGWTDGGLVLLAGLPGRTLRARLSSPGAATPPGADVLSTSDVLGVLDGLPASLTEAPRRRTWGQKGPHYARVLAAAAPELAVRARAIAATVDHDGPEGADVPTHGDFYESQLMVSGGRVTGLLDIDTAGCGERLDDAACLLGHLSVLARLTPSRSSDVSRLGVALQRCFERDLAPDALRRRTAAVVLSLATGPHRVQERHWRRSTRWRIELAEQWLDHASTSRRSAAPA